MFSGIILARAGHTVFDLSQIKQIQQKLQDHPRRNKCMSYQSSLQSLFGLLKFVVMIVFSKKEQYKWSVLITLLANIGAMSSWLLYLNRVRGDKA
jgi:iron-regulated transporter 1